MRLLGEEYQASYGEDWYEGLDVGIRFPVRVLHARGIHTGQSCQGGPGHSYDRPTVDLFGGGPFDGFAALAALEEYGLHVRDLALLWRVERGLISENFWRVTLTQAWPERASETPIFVWGYQAGAEDPAPLKIGERASASS